LLKHFQISNFQCQIVFCFIVISKVPLPNQPHWFYLFNATEEDLQQICISILRVYHHKKVGLLALCDVARHKALYLSAHRLTDDAPGAGCDEGVHRDRFDGLTHPSKLRFDFGRAEWIERLWCFGLGFRE